MAVARLAGVDVEGGEGQMAGDREFRFCKGEFVVMAYEDFVEAAVGGIITSASVELARFVAEVAPAGTWRGLHCVELGSGCGLVSGALVRLDARVVATEQEAFLEHLQWNLGLNAPSHAAADDACCQALDWCDASSLQTLRGMAGGDRGADAMFAANCVYDRSAVDPFLTAIAALSGSDSIAFVCGIPKPSARMEVAEECSVLDAWVSTLPGRFDCYFIPAGSAEDAKVGETECIEIDGTASAGVATVLAQQSGLTVEELADGIWVIITCGAALRPWIRPRFKLGSRKPCEDEAPR